MRQTLIINKTLIGRSRLTRLNTFCHAKEPTAAHYFNMHIARLLCQIFIHWEFFPFLPLRCRRPEGLHRLELPFNRTIEAPSGFWKSSARECFSAAKSILDLAADARVAACFPTNAFALYGIFVAKFIEVYAKAFPWMDPERETSDLDTHTDVHDHGQPIPLSLRPYLSYIAEIEWANDITPVAEQWVSTLDSITMYFETFKHDFNTSLAEQDSGICGPESVAYHANKSLRDGGYGEGREEYELFRHRLCDFGKL